MTRRTLRFDHLEDRCTPVVFGQAWNDPRHLTLSFVPDGTLVGGSTSSLFATLNAHGPTADWQTDILRAVQSWASVGNLDVSVTSDDGSPLGSTRPAQTARRFGDIRIAAVPLAATALAITVPPDPFFADGWSGDIVYNSTNQLNPEHTNLYSVFLQEVGHAFGMANSDAESSVMFGTAETPRTGLNADDVVGLKSLYGERMPDRNEGWWGNQTIGTATAIRPTDGYSQSKSSYLGRFPLVTYGDVTHDSDVDTYSIRNLAGYSGPVSFRVQTAGLSLLAAKVTVYNAAGTVLGTSSSVTLGGDSITVRLNQSSPSTLYYVKVEAATPDEFGVGRYGLAVTFEARNTTSAALLDQILRGPYEMLRRDDINALFSHLPHPHFNWDHGSNDDFAHATALGCAAGYAANTRYEIIGSIDNASDLDFYRVRTAASPGTKVLTVTVAAQPVDGGVPRIELYTAGQLPVPVTVLANADGRYRVQATGLAPNTNYFVRLSGTTVEERGNYALTVLAGKVAAPLETYLVGAVTNSQTQPLTVYQSQIHYFLLSNSGTLATAIRMIIRDDLGRIVVDIQAAGGSTVSSSPVLLAPRPYTVQLTATGNGQSAVGFTIRRAVLSDPIGPVLQDVTAVPVTDFEQDELVTDGIEVAKGILTWIASLL